MRVRGTRNSRYVAALASGLSLSASLLSGCASDEGANAHKGGHGGHAAGTGAGAGAAGAPSAHPMSMGDPNATPANKIKDAKVEKGEFGLLPTRPPGSDSVRGTAWLAQHDEGTTVTVKLTGLKPRAHYLGHLHAKHCDDENGGPHFRFDPKGSELPPNEVHVMVEADASGAATTTVSNDRKTGKNAVAVVVHPYEAQDNRLACADF